MSYKAFKVDKLEDGKIVRVAINRPKNLNAMNPDFFNELDEIFRSLNADEQVRVVLLVGEGKVFTAGLDLKQFGSLFTLDPEVDTARRAIKLQDGITKMQKQFLSILQLRVPVIVGVHNMCIGGGIDLICMADIRYCSKDAQFTIKEIDIGMAADLGTLQFFPNITGNESAFRELAYTGKFMNAEQAQRIGLVSKIFEDRNFLQAGLLQTAKIIANKSPVGIYTLKQIFKRQQYKKVQQSLEYMVRTNSAMLQTQDIAQAITAFFQKRNPNFSKL